MKKTPTETRSDEVQVLEGMEKRQGDRQIVLGLIDTLTRSVVDRLNEAMDLATKVSGDDTTGTLLYIRRATSGLMDAAGFLEAARALVRNGIKANETQIKNFANALDEARKIAVEKMKQTANPSPQTKKRPVRAAARRKD